MASTMFKAIPLASKKILKEIPIDQLFLVAQKERIYARDALHPQGRRVSHKDGYEGYQRDPWTRWTWCEKRAADDEFDWRLFRALEVSERPDGYGIMDGGGRFVMAQIRGIKALPCVVHQNLSPQDEAHLFAKFDRETYKLRSVEHFIASLSAQEAWALDIAAAILPYKVSRSGRGSLSCVGALGEIYTAFERYNTGLQYIRRTAKLIAGPWSGHQPSGDWTTKTQPDGIYFLAVAMMLEIYDDKLDEKVLKGVLTRTPMNKLKCLIIERSVKAKLGKPKTDDFTKLVTKELVIRYNKAAKITSDKLRKQYMDAAVKGSTLIAVSMEAGRTFAARLRQAAEVVEREKMTPPKKPKVAASKRREEKITSQKV